MEKIRIQQNALAFLHRVLSETGVVDRKEARKQSTAFKCMMPAVDAFNKELSEIRMKWRKEKVTKDNNGNENISYYIKDEDKEAFSKEMGDCEDKIVEIEFDKESLSVVTVAFDGLFARQTEEKNAGRSNGLTGEATMKVCDQIETAFAGATQA